MPKGSQKGDKTDENGNLIRPKYVSNHTHYSPTDPDARVSVKPGKARQLNYFGQLAVDDENHVITGACSDFADKRDSQCLEQIVELTKENLQENKITLGEILADGGYSSGEALKYLDDNNIEAWMPNFGQYKPEREGFVYDKENDKYTCSQGIDLPYLKTSSSRKGDEFKVYRSSRKECKNCPLKVTCLGKSHEKTLRDTIHKPLYDKMHQKLTQNAKYAKRMVKVRSKTVEPVLGTLINFLNVKKINSRGIKQANKHVLMASLNYNLKKYLRFTIKKPSVLTQIISLKQGKYFAFVKSVFTDFIISNLSTLNFRNLYRN